VTQRDVVLRWIEEIVRTVLRMLGRGAPADLEDARRTLDDAVERLLGSLTLLVPRLDAASAADLVQPPDRLFDYARLLDLLGAVEEAAGRPERGTALRERAVALAGEAIRRSPDDVPEWRDWLAARTPPV
jgi:hypothetical protein